MATVFITDSKILESLSTLLDRVEHGDEIVFREGDRAVAVMHSPLPPRRTLSECIALARDDSPGIDEDFAEDVRRANLWHREPLDSSVWD